MLPHPCILGDAQTKRDKIGSGCLTPAILGAQNRSEMLCNPAFSGIPKQRGTKSQVAASPLHSPGLTKQGGDKIKIGCLTPAFSGAQKRAEMLPHPCILEHPQAKGDKIKIGCLTPAFFGAPMRAELLPHPCILMDPQTKREKIRIGRLTHTFRGPISGKNATSPLHS